MRTHAFARVRTRMHVYARARTGAHAYARVCTRTHAYAHVRTCTHSYARMSRRTHVYARVRTRMHTGPDSAKISVASGRCRPKLMPQAGGQPRKGPELLFRASGRDSPRSDDQPTHPRVCGSCPARMPIVAKRPLKASLIRPRLISIRVRRIRKRKWAQRWFHMEAAGRAECGETPIFRAHL